MFYLLPGSFLLKFVEYYTVTKLSDNIVSLQTPLPTYILWQPCCFIYKFINCTTLCPDQILTHPGLCPLGTGSLFLCNKMARTWIWHPKQNFKMHGILLKHPHIPAWSCAATQQKHFVIFTFLTAISCFRLRNFAEKIFCNSTLYICMFEHCKILLCLLT
jgi:hypothetical protein